MDRFFIIVFESRWESVGVAAPAWGTLLRLESCRLVLSHLTELFLVNGFCCRVCISGGRLVSFRECVSLLWEIKAPQCWHGLSGYYWSNSGRAVTAGEPEILLLSCCMFHHSADITDHKARLNPDMINRWTASIGSVVRSRACCVTTRITSSRLATLSCQYNYRFCNATLLLQREEKTLRFYFFSATASLCLLVVRN